MKTIHLLCVLSLGLAWLPAGSRALQLEKFTAADLPPVAASAVPAPGRSTSPKEWTVLIYVSARNDLCLDAIKDVNEMEAAGSTDRVNVVAELGRIACEPFFNPFTGVTEPLPPQADWTGSRRFLIRKDSDALTITSPVLQHFPDADMGDWKHLAEFITWGKASFPAKNYLLVVGGHGAGWRGVKPTANKGISYDEPSKNHISPSELARAIKAGGGVNVYASDACLMQTFEVVYELRDSAEYVVGSQESTPAGGYNYAAFLRALAEDPGDALAASQAIMRSFAGFYGAQKKSVTMSILRPAMAAELAVRLDRFARLVSVSPADRKLYHSKKYALRSFDDESARDLYQVAALYSENTATPEVKEAAKDITSFLSGKFIAGNAAVGYKSKGANGVSVYFPLSSFDYKQKYESLSFSRDTFWDEMLRAVMAERN